MGKAFANRKLKEERPKGDFYPTPKSLIWTCKDVILNEFDISKSILEPCCGNGSVSEELDELGFSVVNNDLYSESDIVNFHYDYLQTTKFNNIFQCITNPPFDLWDDFVLKLKGNCSKFMLIGKLNYLGTSGRGISGKGCIGCKFFDQSNFICCKSKKNRLITKVTCSNKFDKEDCMRSSLIWSNLKKVYIFNRYVDYQTPYRDDGKFHVGSQATGWFLWDKDYFGYPEFETVDVQDYACLGAFK